VNEKIEKILKTLDEAIEATKGDEEIGRMWQGKACLMGWLPEHGRTRADVLCTCGARNLFFVWSWAGHGMLRCRACASWISYRTLEVFSSTTSPHQIKGEKTNVISGN
jgi:hypothetical protein